MHRAMVHDSFIQSNSTALVLDLAQMGFGPLSAAFDSTDAYR